MKLIIKSEIVCRRKRLSLLCFFVIKCFLLTAQDSCLNEPVDIRQTSFNNDTIFIKENYNSIKGVKYLNFHFSSLPYEFVLKYYAKINLELKETSEAKELLLKIKLSEVSQKGAIIKDFIFISDNGDSVSLQKLFTREKIILLDFWASWCLPCRKNSDYLKQLYAEFNSIGFSILSISIDESKNNWLKAIHDDKINIWHHGLDNINKTIQNSLGIFDIPTFILINEKLEVIGRFNGRWKGQEDIRKAILSYLR